MGKTRVMRCSDKSSVAKDSVSAHAPFAQKVLAITQFVMLNVRCWSCNGKEGESIGESIERINEFCYD